MKIEIVDLIERDDGGADVTINCDAEFTRAAVGHYFNYMIKSAVNKEDGFDIVDARDSDEEEIIDAK